MDRVELVGVGMSAGQPFPLHHRASYSAVGVSALYSSSFGGAAAVPAQVHAAVQARVPAVPASHHQRPDRLRDAEQSRRSRGAPHGRRRGGRGVPVPPWHRPARRSRRPRIRQQAVSSQYGLAVDLGEAELQPRHRSRQSGRGAMAMRRISRGTRNPARPGRSRRAPRAPRSPGARSACRNTSGRARTTMCCRSTPRWGRRGRAPRGRRRPGFIEAATP